MHGGEFQNFAHEIDPESRSSVYSPPDPHPEELFCKWRFTMKTGEDVK